MNNIIIRTHDCTREELTELQEYLENIKDGTEELSWCGDLELVEVHDVFK